MKATKSIFNLIEIFTKAKRQMAHVINPVEHCRNEALHDFYCEATIENQL